MQKNPLQSEQKEKTKATELKLPTQKDTFDISNK